jgi:UTP--glucose-1-phosphate uridylyltransferase
MHVLTPTVLDLLAGLLESGSRSGGVHLSSALAGLARRERYLAFEAQGRRYDVGAKYGLLTAQLALALASPDRDEVLGHLIELLAQRRQ